MSTTIREEPAYAVKQPKNLSPRIQWLRDYYFQGDQAQMEQRIHRLDDRHPVGFPVQRDHLLHRAGDLHLSAHLPGLSSRARRPVELHSGFLAVEPAGAARLVRARR